MEFWEAVKGYLTPETITVITTVILFLVALLKLVSVVKNLKEQHTLTMDNLLKLLSVQNKEEFDKAKIDLNKSVVDLIEPIIPYFKTFAKILALSQENTPESKVAILNLIEELGTIDANLVNEAKNVINNQVATEEAMKLATIQKLEKIEAKPQEQNRPVE